MYTILINPLLAICRLNQEYNKLDMLTSPGLPNPYPKDIVTNDCKVTYTLGSPTDVVLVYQADLEDVAETTFKVSKIINAYFQLHISSIQQLNSILSRIQLN